MTDPVGEVEQNAVHTGLQIIQQGELHAHTKPARYRLDVARVECAC